MTYEEIQQELGSIMISLAEPVSVKANDYTHLPTEYYIVGCIDNVILELQILKQQIKET